MEFKLSDVQAAVGGVFQEGGGAGDIRITGITTDSRECGPGFLFVPIRGERQDGHDFILSAFANGAAASFSSRPVPEAPGPVLLVPDPLEALRALGAWRRGQLAIPVVGVTGSVGKTTTKEMVAQTLAAGFRVYKTPGNHNGQIGVPITLCGVLPEDTAAVVEMGVSVPGEMDRIAAVARPTHAVMTAIGTSHLAYMKTRENILSEKARIAQYIPPEGALFVNGDDDLLPTLKETASCRVWTFGLGPACDWRGLSLQKDDDGTDLVCRGPGGEETALRVPVPGEHHARDALAAFAVARTLGVPAEDAARALAAYQPPRMRQEIQRAHGLTVINDTYNASLDSVKPALDVLADRRVSGRRVAVLADMMELGDFAREGHFQAGRHARLRGIDLLVAIGPLARSIAEGYGQGAAWFETNGEAAAYLLERLRPGDTVLVKGSRGMRTEEIVAVLLAEAPSLAGD